MNSIWKSENNIKINQKGGNAMERDNISAKADQSIERSTAIYVDGCKVTIKYSKQENPPALRAIRDVLINSISSTET